MHVQCRHSHIWTKEKTNFALRLKWSNGLPHLVNSGRLFNVRYLWTLPIRNKTHPSSKGGCTAPLPVLRITCCEPTRWWLWKSVPLSLVLLRIVAGLQSFDSRQPLKISISKGMNYVQSAAFWYLHLVLQPRQMRDVCLVDPSEHMEFKTVWHN